MAPRYFDRSAVGKSVDILPTVFTTVTVTCTTVRWVEPSSTLKRVVSRSQKTASFDSPLASHAAGESNFNLHQAIGSNGRLNSETTASPRFNTLASTCSEGSVSAYPRMLFDHSAAAPTSHDSAHYHDLPPYVPSGIMEGGEFELPDIPPSVQIALFACLGAGALWSVLVWLINSPSTPSNRTTEEKQAGKNKVVNKTWWKCIWGDHNLSKDKKKLINKPSKYAPLAPSPTVDTPASSEDVLTVATTSATPERVNESLIRLRKMAPTAKPQVPSSPSLPPWKTPTPEDSTPQVIREQRPRHGSNTTADSPTNPFLPHPLNPRSSVEYLAAHRVFFSKPLPTPPPQTTALLPPPLFTQPSPYASRSSSPVSDLDALEAQHDIGVPPRRSRSSRSVLQIADGVEKTGGRIWTGGWAAAVEGGVNRAVDAMVRWTEDDGGEEGLLLPVGNKDA